MRVALFDFDQTLIRQNSLGPLFKAASGLRRLWPHAVPAAFSAVMKGELPHREIKERLYQRCLANCTEQQIYELGIELSRSLTPIQQVVDALHAHNADGGSVWIVTASPAPFVRGVLDALGWPYERLLGTELPKSDGAYTGQLHIECSHDEKVKRIETEVSSLQCTAELVVAYGNLPPDAPMLNMANKGYAVEGGNLTLFSNLGR